MSLPRSFYGRDALDVAPELLNKVVAVGDRSLRIVEVEAYRGADDPGSHGYRGRTPRTEVMFGRPGMLYVYFSYGMHWCANVVCGREGECMAVLLRAGAPLTGMDAMRDARPAARRDIDLANGPAKLTQALGIAGVDNGADLVAGDRIRILSDGVAAPPAPGRSTRIGLTNGADLPWRWFVPDDANVSRRR